jgi:hypothetical protein
MNLFGLSPYLTLPKYWSYQIFLCLFGLLPFFWLPIGLHVVGQPMGDQILRQNFGCQFWSGVSGLNPNSPLLTPITQPSQQHCIPASAQQYYSSSLVPVKPVHT